MATMTCSEFAHEFAYTGKKGPAHWAEYCPDCGKHQQSPINIVTTDARAEPHPVALNYHCRPQPKLEIVNTGQTIQATYTAGTLSYNGVTYQSQQYHFHTPSEHTINGHTFGIEMHVVHQSDTGEYAVLGYMVEVRENGWPAVDDIFEACLHAPNKGDRYNTPAPSPDLPFSTDSPCYQYMGSLTTPPCTEGVRWFVLSEPSYISRAVYERVIKSINNNNRPVQPLTDRTISKATIKT